MRAYNISILIGSLLIISLSALAFTEPAVAPPGGNVMAPINVSGIAQTKTGKLNIGSGLSYWITKVGDSFALENNAGATQFIVGQDGSVGIGTTNPNAKLDFGSADSTTLISSNAPHPWFFRSTPSGYHDILWQRHEDTAMRIWNFNTSSYLLDINQNGRIGIGKQADGNVALDVQAKSGGYGLAVRDSASGSFLNFSADNGRGFVGYNTSNGGYGMKIEGTGRIEVQSNTWNGIQAYCWGCYALRGVGFSGGTVVAGGGESADFVAQGPGQDYASGSSIRWKKDVRSISWSC